MHCCRCYQRKQTTGAPVYFKYCTLTNLPNLWIATSTAGSPRAVVNCKKTYQFGKSHLKTWQEMMCVR